jgi:acyl carrier protein
MVHREMFPRASARHRERPLAVASIDADDRGVLGAEAALRDRVHTAVPRLTVSARSVTRLLARQLGVERVRVVPTARLFDELGASPLALVQVALALEERFDIEIAAGDVALFATVEDVMACVARARRRRDSRLRA